jgi:hypothetical protein
MRLEGLHILLTYQCSYECDHCFVWGSPWQKGTLTLEQMEQILEQAKGLASLQFILKGMSGFCIMQSWYRLFAKRQIWDSPWG